MVEIVSLLLFLTLLRVAARTATFRFPGDLDVESYQRSSLTYECLLLGSSLVEEVIERLPGLIHADTRVIEQRQRQPTPYTLSTFP